MTTLQYAYLSDAEYAAMTDDQYATLDNITVVQVTHNNLQSLSRNIIVDRSVTQVSQNLQTVIKNAVDIAVVQQAQHVNAQTLTPQSIGDRVYAEHGQNLQSVIAVNPNISQHAAGIQTIGGTGYFYVRQTASNNEQTLKVANPLFTIVQVSANVQVVDTTGTIQTTRFDVVQSSQNKQTVIVSRNNTATVTQASTRHLQKLKLGRLNKPYNFGDVAPPGYFIVPSEGNGGYTDITGLVWNGGAIVPYPSRPPDEAIQILTDIDGNDRRFIYSPVGVI